MLRDLAAGGHWVDMGVWVTCEVWLHRVGWGETVDCLQEPPCSMAQVRVWEQEEEPPETDGENQESEKDSGAECC